MEPKMAKIGQCSGRPETAKKQFFKPLHASLATRCNMATFMSFQRRFFSSSIFFLSLVLSHFAFHPEFSFLTISGTKLSDEGDQTMKGGRQGQARDWQKKSEKYNNEEGRGFGKKVKMRISRQGRRDIERNIESC